MKIYLKLVLSLSCLIITSANLLGNKLETYPGVKDKVSSVYRVDILQGRKQENSFVYKDSNTFAQNGGSITEHNHWTNFAFDGKKVTVVVTFLDDYDGKYEIRPLQKEFKSYQKGNKIFIELPSAEKFYVYTPVHQKDPLFVFANEIMEKPKEDDSNVVYFGPGIHDVGKHYMLKSGTTYFLDGGAYVKGSFVSEDNATDIKVCGHGILSGENIPHGSYKEHRFDRVALRLLGHGKTNFTVEGITIINPAQYCIQAYGGQLSTRNVKCFGWYYETDGWVGGDNSILSDSFFKVYDDIVKVYFDNIEIRNLTIYKQHNGAVLQLGWGNESSQGARIQNIYVVKDDTRWNEETLEGNRGFLNAANGNYKNKIRDLRISQVYYDGNISYLMGIRSLGNYNDIAISDMYIKGKQLFKSYLSGGVFKDIKLDNVFISGEHIERNQDIDLRTQGCISPILYR